MSEPIMAMLAGLSPLRRSFTAGSVLFRQSDPVERLHLVLDGEVHLVRHHADGSSLVLQRARAGDLLAEASLFSEHYHCDAQAAQPTTTMSVSKAAARAAFHADDRFASTWASYLAHRVQEARIRAEILSMRTVAERLDAWLAASEGRPPARGGWRSVASEIGVSPEALYRELSVRRKATAGKGRS